MDLDVIVQKDLGELKENFAAIGSSSLIYCGVLDLALDPTGREIASNLMKYIELNSISFIQTI